jgi:hypothetical protein
MAYRDDEISGMRGWLLFFFLTLAVIQPLFLDYRLLISVGTLPEDAAAQSAWPLFMIAMRFLFVAIVVTSWLLAACLWFSRKWRMIRIVIAGIWAIYFGAISFTLVAMLFMIGIDPALAWGVAISGSVVGIFYCGAWTAYLLRSRRVANTYHRYLDDDGLANVFD